jgi:hypothetical protein
MDDVRREIEQITDIKKGSNKSNPITAGSPGEIVFFIYIYKYSYTKI